MKKLLIGLTLLASMSSFALEYSNCKFPEINKGQGIPQMLRNIITDIHVSNDGSEIVIKGNDTVEINDYWLDTIQHYTYKGALSGSDSFTASTGQTVLNELDNFMDYKDIEARSQIDLKGTILERSEEKIKIRIDSEEFYKVDKKTGLKLSRDLNDGHWGSDFMESFEYFECYAK